MNNAMLTRTAVLGASAALCLGVNVPAMAHTDSASTAPAQKAQTAKVVPPTLAQEQAWIDRFVTLRQQGLQRFAAAVAADPKLTATQKAAVAAKIAAAQAALTALKAKVDAATSTDQVRAIVKAALAALPHPAWPHLDARRHQTKALRHHHAPKPTTTKATTTKATDAAVRISSVRQVTVHRSQAQPRHGGRAGDGFDRGRHSDGNHHGGHHDAARHDGGKHRR